MRAQSIVFFFTGILLSQITNKSSNDRLGCIRSSESLMVILRPILSVFYRMSSAILLAKILVLLMNVRSVKQGLQCNWLCNVTETRFTLEEIVPVS